MRIRNITPIENTGPLVEVERFWRVRHITRVNLILALPLLPYFFVRRLFKLLFGQQKVNQVFQRASIASTSDLLGKVGVPSQIRPWIDVRTRFGYEPNLTGLLCNIRGKIFLDIGSHMGYYAWLLSKNFDRVFAFEPNPTNYQMLANTIRFGKLKNVKPVKTALSDREGTATLYYSPRSGNQSLLGREQQRGFLVKTTTLDSLAGEPVDLVKIDVEGAEWMVVKGGEKVLNDGKIKRLLIEIHDESERAKFEQFFLEKRYETSWPDPMHLFAQER